VLFELDVTKLVDCRTDGEARERLEHRVHLPRSPTATIIQNAWNQAIIDILHSRSYHDTCVSARADPP
jgi:hypothetical protein